MSWLISELNSCRRHLVLMLVEGIGLRFCFELSKIKDAICFLVILLC